MIVPLAASHIASKDHASVQLVCKFLVLLLGLVDHYIE